MWIETAQLAAFNGYVSYVSLILFLMEQMNTSTWKEDLTDFIIEQVFSNLDDGSVSLSGFVHGNNSVPTGCRGDTPFLTQWQ